MALGFLYYDKGTVYGGKLNSVMGDLENALNRLNGMLGTMTQMIDGDGSNDSHYTEMTSRFGFTSNAVAHNAFNELGAMHGKLFTDASVTNVRAATVQAINKLR